MLVSEQMTMPGGAHLSSHGKKGLRASTGRLSPWHGGLVSLAGRSHHMSPGTSQLATSKGGVTGSITRGLRYQACWQAPGCYLKPPEHCIVIFQVLRQKLKEATRPLLFGCREIKSALLQIHGWCELIKCPVRMAKIKELCGVPNVSSSMHCSIVGSWNLASFSPVM